MKVRILIFFLLFYCAFPGFCQKEVNVWPLQGKMINFNTKPFKLTNGGIIPNLISSSMCDKDGNLLFYTDGLYVRDRFHKIMKNGSGLKGVGSNGVNVICAPYPNSNGLYYIFTCGGEMGNSKYPHLDYNIVDMNKGNLKEGEVVVKNQRLLDSIAGKMTIVRHSNGRSFWLITQKWISGEFYAFEINEKGISSPVISKCSEMKPPITFGNRAGVMRASTDGKLIAIAQAALNGLEVYNFNAASGELKYYLSKSKSSTTDFLKRIPTFEFSPNSRFIYLCESRDTLYINGPGAYSIVWQIDLNAGDTNQIKNWNLYIGNNSIVPYTYDPNGSKSQYGGCQLTPHGTILLSNSGKCLDCILKPNEKGAYCSYTRNYLCDAIMYFPFNFPVFIPSYFFMPDFEAKPMCRGDTTKFDIQDKSKIDSVFWCFGDTLSGQNNYSKLLSPAHVFSDTGTYNVSVVYWHEGGKADTFERKYASALIQKQIFMSVIVYNASTNKHLFSMIHHP